MSRPRSLLLARLLPALGALAPTIATAAPRELTLTPLAWSVLGGVALAAILLAGFLLRRGRSVGASDDAPLGRYIGPLDEAPGADGEATELPAAIRTRRNGVPFDAQPLPEPLPFAGTAPLQGAGGTDPELARIVGIARATPPLP